MLNIKVVVSSVSLFLVLSLSAKAEVLKWQCGKDLPAHLKLKEELKVRSEKWIASITELSYESEKFQLETYLIHTYFPEVAAKFESASAYVTCKKRLEEFFENPTKVNLSAWTSCQENRYREILPAKQAELKACFQKFIR